MLDFFYTVHTFFQPAAHVFWSLASRGQQQFFDPLEPCLFHNKYIFAIFRETLKTNRKTDKLNINGLSFPSPQGEDGFPGFKGDMGIKGDRVRLHNSSSCHT